METMVFKSGNSLAVRLPKGFKFECGKVELRREGDKIIIEKLSNEWPVNFFEDVRISRSGFKRELVPYIEKKL